MIQYIILFNRNGQIKWNKWYNSELQKDKEEITNQLIHICLTTEENTQTTHFLSSHFFTYQRFSTLYFCIGFDSLEDEVRYFDLIQFIMNICGEVFPQIHEIDFLSRNDDITFVFDLIISHGCIINTNKNMIIKKCQEKFDSSSLYCFH